MILSGLIPAELDTTSIDFRVTATDKQDLSAWDWFTVEFTGKPVVA